MKYYLDNHTMAIDNRKGSDISFPFKSEHIISELEINLLESEEDFDKLKYDWNLLTKYAKVGVFQTYDWLRTWWKYFGIKNTLYILAIRHEGVLVGLVPLYRDNYSLFGWSPYCSLRLIGSTIPNETKSHALFNFTTSNYLDFIIHPDYERTVAQVLLKYFDENRDHYDEIMLHELPENGTALRILIPLLEKKGIEYEMKRGAVCTKVHLPSSIDHFLNGMDNRSRYRNRKSNKSYKKKELFAIHNIKNESELYNALDLLIDFRKKQWDKEDFPGLFDNYRYKSFIYDVSKIMLENNRLMVKTAETEDACIAVNYALKYKDTIYDFLKGIDINSPMAEFGPGHSLVSATIEDAIKDGFKMADYMRGDEQYKFKAAKYSSNNWDVRIPSMYDTDQKRYNIYKMLTGYSSLKKKMIEELQFIRLHMQNDGYLKFMSSYYHFLYSRMKNNLSSKS